MRLLYNLASAKGLLSVLVLCGKSLVNMLRLHGIDTWRARFQSVDRAFPVSQMSRSTFRDDCLYLG